MAIIFLFLSFCVIIYTNRQSTTKSLVDLMILMLFNNNSNSSKKSLPTFWFNLIWFISRADRNAILFVYLQNICTVQWIQFTRMFVINISLSLKWSFVQMVLANHGKCTCVKLSVYCTYPSQLNWPKQLFSIQVHSSIQIKRNRPLCSSVLEPVEQ